MAISFARPYLLILIPIFILFVWYTSKRLVKMYDFRRKIILILRNTLFILIILAVSGLSIKWSVNREATIFVIDSSDSMKMYTQQTEDFIRESLKEKKSKDFAGVVAFGDDASVESFVSKNTVFSKVETSIKGTFTNIENAITIAISLFPNNAKKRIVLLTDGEENAGNSMKLASSILESGIDFKVYKINRDIKDEVAIDGVEVPQSLNKGQDFTVTVNIDSKVRTGAQLTLFNGRQMVSQTRVELQSGKNKFVFKDKADEGGFRSYRVVVQPDKDTIAQNNEASAFTNVKDTPRVLIIEDKNGEGEEIAKMLSLSGIKYNLVNAVSAPTTLQEMSSYKSIITCNVSAENLNEGFLNSIETYVRDLGGGFIATGGDNSFALGGYFKTSIEKILPVKMELKGKKEIPDMALMLIIDKSGSMSEASGGITKVDIAKEAAARSLDSLRPNKDNIGVIAFDGAVYTVVPMQRISNADKIRDDIGTIRPEGGTSILPALDEGYNALKKSNAKIKHIILLTDGEAEKTGYDEIIQKINKDNITVSTVAVGGSSDSQLLDWIARSAKGRFYHTDQFANIPRIFAKETFMAARAYINNRAFTPNIISSHQILSGAGETGLPKLLGYVAASPKSAARVVLSSDTDDPILSVWQYGLGKTAAWNSDMNGKWSSNYTTWEKNARLWQNIVNWTMENYSDDKSSVQAIVNGNKGVITFEDKEEKEELETIATIISPDLKSREIKLFPISPGKYSSEFDLKDVGAYMVKIRQMKNGEIVKAISTGLPVQYSPEYKLNADGNKIDRLVNETGGKYINTPKEVFKGKIKNMWGQTELTSLLLILSLIVFILDIALRRLNLPLQEIENRLKTIRDRFKYTKSKTTKKTKIITHTNPTKQSNINDNPTINKEINKKNKNTEKPQTSKNDNLDVSKLLKSKENRYK